MRNPSPPCRSRNNICLPRMLHALSGPSMLAPHSPSPGGKSSSAAGARHTAPSVRRMCVTSAPESRGTDRMTCAMHVCSEARGSRNSDCAESRNCTSVYTSVSTLPVRHLRALETFHSFVTTPLTPEVCQPRWSRRAVLRSDIAISVTWQPRRRPAASPLMRQLRSLNSSPMLPTRRPRTAAGTRRRPS